MIHSFLFDTQWHIVSAYQRFASLSDTCRHGGHGHGARNRSTSSSFNAFRLDCFFYVSCFVISLLYQPCRFGVWGARTHGETCPWSSDEIQKSKGSRWEQAHSPVVEWICVSMCFGSLLMWTICELFCWYGTAVASCCIRNTRIFGPFWQVKTSVYQKRKLQTEEARRRSNGCVMPLDI